MKISVRAYEIAGLLDRMPEGVTTLSLDCFDTLLWRSVQAPLDVFSEIDLPGGGIEPRRWAEGIARQTSHLRHRKSEVLLSDVYRQLLPDADEAGIDAAVAHELAMEAKYCFAFRPTVELMIEAKKRGLQLILVSDMYMSEPQLRELLTRAAGEEVVALIDQIFMSSEYGTGKSHDLFKIVLATLGLVPEQMVHVGDNKAADYTRPAELGINVAHMIQFDVAAEQRLRLEAAASALIDPTTRISQPASQPHRGEIAMRVSDEPAAALGYDVIGPSMYAFVTWLKGELDAFAAEVGKPVRPLFLMRDGFLPMKAFEALYPAAGAAAVEISRIVAARAALHDKEALDAYLDRTFGALPHKLLAKHLMLTNQEVAHASNTRPGQSVDDAMDKSLRSDALQAKILDRAHAFGEKLVSHLANAGVREGDAVMLVDIGYNGTVQNILEPYLRKRLNLDVCGRYMFLREIEKRSFDKAGLIDTRNYENRTLHALSSCVGFLELLWNSGEGSTVDLTEDGHPIREATDAKASQSATRDRVQEACLAYVQGFGAGTYRAAHADTIDARRRMAAATLARLFFLPTGLEVELFQSFDYDLNMGSNRSVKLFDREAAVTGLRHKGLSYVNSAIRMYVPAEIQSHGLAMNLSLLTSLRYSLDLRESDFAVGGIKVPVILIDAKRQTMQDFEAFPTAEGYYRLVVPIGMGGFTAAIQLGSVCEWLQLEDAKFMRVSQLNSMMPEGTLPATLVPDGMTARAPELFEAEPHGVLIAPPPAIVQEPMALTLIFRPVRWRKAAGAKAAVQQAA